MNMYYHPGIANVVVDALRRLSMYSLYQVKEEKKNLVKDVHCLCNLGVQLLDLQDGGLIVQEVDKSSLCSKDKEK